MTAFCAAGAMIGIAAGTALVAHALLVWANPTWTVLQDIPALLLPPQVLRSVCNKVRTPAVIPMVRSCNQQQQHNT